jgi:4-hydroxy-tetrahydrodipicolinate synthase
MNTAALTGIIPPLVTPLSGRDRLDHAGLERLIEHVVSGGVSGLFILGTTGEAPALSLRLRRELVERTCKQVAGRLPVLVGVSDPSFEETLGMAAFAAEKGADFTVAAPPYYWPLGDSELEAYYEHLADEVALPLFLYNMPGLTKATIPMSVVRRGLQHPRVVGMKDSSGSMGYLHQVLRLRGERSDWPVFVGDEETLLYAVEAGAQGGVNGGANVFPKLYAAYHRAAAAGDLEKARVLQRLVVRMGDLYKTARHGSSTIRGIKCGLSLLGICGDLAAEPFQTLTAEERRAAAGIVEELSTAVF